MWNTKRYMVTTTSGNTQGDPAPLVAAKLCRGHVPASQPLARLGADCPLPVPTGDSPLLDHTPAGREFSQEFGSGEDRAIWGSLTSQVSEVVASKRRNGPVDSEKKRAK